MTPTQALSGLLHRATHSVPGVPAHAVQPSGHQGRARPAGPPHRHAGHRHVPAGPPRVLIAWQHRIAALFGQNAR